MSDWNERHEKPQRDPTEGVRLIGADEAAEAYERGDVTRRLPEDEPRFGDRPPSPDVDTSRPALRFPLGSSDDPSTFERPATVPVPPRTEAPELSHWAGSAAEEVPNMSRRDPRQPDDRSWSAAGAGPRWRDDVPDEPAAPPAGNWPPPEPGPPQGPPPGPPAGSPAYEEGGGPPAGRSVFGDVGDEPVYEDAYDDEGYGDEEYAAEYGDTYADDAYEGDHYGGQPAPGGYPGAPGGGAPMAPPVAVPKQAAGPRRSPLRRGTDRDMRTAVLVGVGFAAVALALFHFGGPVGAMVLVVPVVGYAAYEYFVGVHQAGLQPLLPVGVVAAVGAVLAAYNYGEAALLLTLVLTTAVCFLWYLVNAGGDRPAANIGVTLLGVVWVGMFGSFAALLLSAPHGIGFLLAAVIPTVAYDVGGLFVGRSAGSRSLSAASPNKTIEGLAGGMFLALVAGLVFGQVGVTPIDGLGEGLKIGLVVALAAPIGDLAESLIKRDLDLKDMGHLLPGHGGLLDRFDALLFVLPAVWYLARVSDFFLT